MGNSLITIYRKFAKETALLEQAIESPCSTVSLQQRDFDGQLVREMCVMRLQDSWARFCRDLVIMSSWAEPMTAQGSRVAKAPRIRRARDVIPTLISTYTRRTTEPNWHIPSESIDAAQRLRITNYNTVKSGLSLSFSHSPTEQVRCLRNYFAHRSENTAKLVQQVAMNMGIPSRTIPHSLTGSIVQTGISMFSLWVLRLRTMAWLAIQ